MKLSVNVLLLLVGTFVESPLASSALRLSECPAQQPTRRSLGARNLKGSEDTPVRVGPRPVKDSGYKKNTSPYGQKSAFQHHGRGDTLRARDAYLNALRNRPNSSTYYKLALVYESMGSLPEAMRAFRDSVRLKPSSLAYWHMGMICRISGRYREAIEAYKQALKLDPRNAQLYDALGSAYGPAGQVNSAIAAYRHSIRLDPQSSSPHNGLGVAYTRLGKNKEAFAEFSKALSLDPDNKEARRNYTSTLTTLRMKGKKDL